MIPLRRILIGCLVAALTLFLVAIGAILSAPFWVDSNTVKKEIAALVFRATGDVVRLDRIELRLFPPFSVEIARPRYTASGGVDIEAKSAAVDLDFWGLIFGRVQPRGIRVNELRATIQLPASTPGAEPFSLANVDRQLREVMAQIVEAAPNLRASAEHAAITLLMPGRPPLTLSNIRLRVQTSGGRLDGDLTCASDLWERMSLKFSVEKDDLKGSGRLEFVGLQAAPVTDLFGGGAQQPRIEAQVLGHMDWQMQGLARMRAEAVVFSPRIVLTRNGATQAFEGVNLGVGLETKGSAMELRAHDLYVRTPHLMLGGNLSRDEHGRLGLEIQASGVDLVSLQAAARNLMPEIPGIANPPVSLLAGTLTALDLHSSAETLPQLFDLSLLQGEAAVEGVALALARPAITVTAIAGRATLDHGELRLESVKAALGKSKLQNTKLAINLLEPSTGLQAEAVAALDLKETMTLARKVITRKDIRSQLDDVEKIDGSALAHVTLSGNPQSLQTTVDVSELALSVRHRKVPLSIRISGGQIAYAGDAITIGGASGAIGRSSFSGLNASLKLAPPYRFAISQSIAQLSLDELFAVAAAVPDLTAVLSEIQSLTGTITLSNLQAEGSLDALQATHFHAVASPRNVKIHARRFEPEAGINGGSVDISERRIEARDIAVTAMDSALQVSAQTDEYRAGVTAVGATVNGALGADTLAWIYRTADLPAKFQVRSPLRFKDAQIGWQSSGEISFKGAVSVAGSTDLSIAVSKAANGIKFERVTLKDRSSDATFSGDLAGRLLNTSFKGHLSGETLVGVFVEPPFSMDVLEGDILVDLDLDKPEGMHAKGSLQGSAITVPGGAAGPVTLERFVLKADGTEITIGEAAVSSGENRATLKGKIRYEDKKFVVDADLHSEKIVLPKSLTEPKPEADTKPHKFNLADLPVAGRIGVDIRQLETDKLKFSPLVAEARLTGAKLELNIKEAALCGITLFGNLNGELDDLQLVGTLSARKADLASSVPCLTGDRIQSSGLMDVDAHFTARGSLETLAEHLDGQFLVTARDGNIEKFETLKKVFAVLNVTEAIRGKNLAVAAKGLPYRIFSAKGTVAGTALHFDEVLLDAPTVRVVATGRVDVGTGKLGMDVLVAPLQTANAILDKIPLLDRIFGGAVLALPVGVRGALDSPIIIPLGPGAVASQLANIFANTLRLPFDAIKIFTPKAGDSGKTPAANK